MAMSAVTEGGHAAEREVGAVHGALLDLEELGS